MRRINHISHKYIVENNHFGSKQRNSYNNLADDKTKKNFFLFYIPSNMAEILRHLIFFLKITHEHLMTGKVFHQNKHIALC